MNDPTMTKVYLSFCLIYFRHFGLPEKN